jgi:hypothetical protein
MDEFNVEELRQHIDSMLENVGVQAHVDQQAAALDRIRDNGTWWAALSMLGQERGNTVATALATRHLKEVLAQEDPEMLVILSAYLLHNTINLVANHYESGSIAAAVLGMVGPEDFTNFEKFVATSGTSCPDCGADNGWAEHVCKPVTKDDKIES